MFIRFLYLNNLALRRLFRVSFTSDCSMSITDELGSNSAPGSRPNTAILNYNGIRLSLAPRGKKQRKETLPKNNGLES